MSDFPKMLYRAEGAAIASRVVNSEADAQAAAGEGWGDRATAKAAAARPAGVNANSARGEVGAGAQTARDSGELAKTKEALAASQEAAESAREYAKALGERVDALETFLRGLAADENAPEPLRADITALLGGEAQAESQAAAQPKKGRGKKADA